MPSSGRRGNDWRSVPGPGLRPDVHAAVTATTTATSAAPIATRRTAATLSRPREHRPECHIRCATMQIVTTLVERSAQLDVLRGAAGRVGPGAGAVALVTGEAGIGKTALVRAFAADLPPHWVVLSGGCDDLLTPRPLGPLRDVARDGPPALRAALADGSRDDLLEALLACLAGEQPTFLLIEDVHWADDATLDALRQLARRLDRVHALVVLTCRPDDVAPGHPLQALLGDLARARRHPDPAPPPHVRGDRRARERGRRGRAGEHGRQPVLRHRSARGAGRGGARHRRGRRARAAAPARARRTAGARTACGCAQPRRPQARHRPARRVGRARRAGAARHRDRRRRRHRLPARAGPPRGRAQPAADPPDRAQPGRRGGAARPRRPRPPAARAPRRAGGRPGHDPGVGPGRGAGGGRGLRAPAGARALRGRGAACAAARRGRARDAVRGVRGRAVHRAPVRPTARASRPTRSRCAASSATTARSPAPSSRSRGTAG